MTIVNIRGTSGSGKSTLVHRFLRENFYKPVFATFDNWKQPKIVAYQVSYNPKWTPVNNVYGDTYVIGRYETQCGGCDAMSYKGSHDDIESLVRKYAKLGNVIFEGLTISSTITRWQRISEEYPGQFVWAFMSTPVTECHQRILARNGGKEPKRDAKGLADYEKKFSGCVRQMANLKESGEKIVELTSDDAGYLHFLRALNNYSG